MTKEEKELIEAIYLDQLNRALVSDYSRLEKEIETLKSEINRLEGNISKSIS